MIRSFCIALVNLFLHCVFRIRVVGKENMPTEGGAIVAVNHKSNWDVVCVGAFCPRRLRFMAKSELFKNRIFGGLIRSLGAFPIKRGTGDIGAIKLAVKILRGNDPMLMFPEGMRSDGSLEHAKPGIALIAQMARVPVIPTYISGEYKFMKRITITFGKPYDMSEYYEKKLSGEQLQTVADEILAAIRDCNKN